MHHGQQVLVNFGDLVYFEERGKPLQELNVIYKNKDVINKKRLYMEAHLKKDENGNVTPNAKQHLDNIAAGNYSLLLDFFDLKDIERLETNYIGTLHKREIDEKYCRGLDYNFIDKYLEHKKELKRREKENDFKQGLKSQIQDDVIHQEKKSNNIEKENER